MMNIKLKTVLRIVMRTYKTLLIKSCINREDKRKSTHFSYTDVVLT